MASVSSDVLQKEHPDSPPPADRRLEQPVSHVEEVQPEVPDKIQAECHRHQQHKEALGGERDESLVTFCGSTFSPVCRNYTVYTGGNAFTPTYSGGAAYAMRYVLPPCAHQLCDNNTDGAHSHAMDLDCELDCVFTVCLVLSHNPATQHPHKSRHRLHCFV